MPSAGAALILDVPTLTVVAVGLADLLGLFLVFCWLQERSVRALAWWATAYFIGAFSFALWINPASARSLPAEIPETLTLLACGVLWSGIRLFHGRRVDALPAVGGSVIWPLLCQFPGLEVSGKARLILMAGLVATYTFAIAREFWRERRQSLVSRAAGVLVPALHAAVFLSGPAMHLFWLQNDDPLWLTLFIVQVMIYSVGTALIVLLAVKDRHLGIYRHAAETDPLTSLLNRRGFHENGLHLVLRRSMRGQPVTVMMFDLDHFKSINDRFGHAVGDVVLGTFADVLRANMRSSDVVGRLGGEEFAAILPGDRDVAALVGERVRAAFETVGAIVDGHAIGGTVSIGAASAVAPLYSLDQLIERADAALYVAKRSGRNRLCTADDLVAMPIPVPLVPVMRPTSTSAIAG